MAQQYRLFPLVVSPARNRDGPHRRPLP